MSEQTEPTFADEMDELYPEFKAWYDVQVAQGGLKRLRAHDMLVGYTAGRRTLTARVAALEALVRRFRARYGHPNDYVGETYEFLYEIDAALSAPQ